MRFKVLLAGLAVVSLATPGAAQPAGPDFSADAFRAHVAFLADDLLEGRDTGSRGYDIAARYVATQFEALGLRPALADGRWLQPIDFLRFRLSGTPSLTVGGRNFALGPGLSFRPRPEAASVEAPAVFAGYGLDMPAHGYRDYDGLDVRGRIVVVLAGYPRGTASDVGAHLSAAKRQMAALRGAVGMIEIRAPSATPRSAAAAAAAATRPGTTWIGRDGAPYSEASGLSFIASIDRATAAAMFPAARLARALRAAERGGRPRGFDLGVHIRAEQGSSSERFASANVLALLPGTDPALASEPVLLMAHLDGLGVREAGQGDRIRNGAMDNAAGVATLIEVARAMSRLGHRPRRPILFAAVTAEEIGLLGASYLAHNPATRGGVIAVVNLDMPILTYEFTDVTAFGAEHSTLGPIVARAAARMGVAVAPDPLPEQGLFTRSDHYRFVQRGVPSVFLMTGFANGGRERFAAFLDERYHGPGDDLGQPFDWAAGARFARLNYLIAREIADGAQAPLWYRGSFFGDSFGGERPRAERPASGPAR